MKHRLRSGLVALAALASACLSGGCAIWGYSVKPESAMDLEPVQATRNERLHYWVSKVSGMTFGGEEGMRDEFEACAIFKDKRVCSAPPAQGLHVLARAVYREPSVGALVWGYIDLGLLMSLPAYSGSGGFDLHFKITRDQLEVRTYHYKVNRRIFAWLPLIPFVWILALTCDEDEAFAALTRQFFHDAIRDGAFDERPAGKPEGGGGP
ncbi:MAG: hypothetical protein JXR96_09965 [Deltaproteobacteria bacterium]|nr:hypothetical protein [Deltaproteobacteria bacterium]